VDSRDTAAEIIAGVEDCGVHIGNLLRRSQQLGRRRREILLDAGKQTHGTFCPHRPVTEQASDDSTAACRTEIEFGEQVRNNVVVVAGVERDFAAAAAFQDGANNVYEFGSG
jgi:hypothetical protein